MKALLTIATVMFFLTAITAQPKKGSVVIGSMTTRPNALLIVNPENSNQGVLLPQLSTGQRMSMKPSSPEEDGLIVFDVSRKSYYYWSAGAWQKLAGESPVKTSFYRVDPASFRALAADYSTPRNGLAIFDSDNTFVTTTDAGAEAIIAPITLPHGAVLTEVKVHYMDNDDHDLRVSLVRTSVAGRNDLLISWQSSGVDPYVKTQTFNSFNSMGTIDLEKYAYRLVVRFDLDDGEIIDIPQKAGQRVYGVTIKYQE